MKKTIQTITMAIAIITTCLLLTQCGSQPKTKELTFATEATYAPFAFMQADGKIAGFGADIVHAVCKQMQQKCDLINSPFSTLFPSLKLGKYDALFGGLQITPAREKVVAFSKSYYEDTVTFVVNKHKAFGLNDSAMTGKTIGVQVGTTYAQYLQQKYGQKITLKTYASDMSAFLDLQSGRLDAVFTDKPVAIAWLKKQNNAQFSAAGNIVDQKFFGKGYGIAIKKGNTKLLTAVNNALTTIKQNGEYAKIVHKWFSD